MPTSEVTVRLPPSKAAVVFIGGIVALVNNRGEGYLLELPSLIWGADHPSQTYLAWEILYYGILLLVVWCF